MAEDVTTAIQGEIATAIKRLGGEPSTVNLADTWQVNRVLEFLGADMYLLCTVGSWGDTLPDAEVLKCLREWNRGQSLAPEVSFVAWRCVSPGRGSVHAGTLGAFLCALVSTLDHPSLFSHCRAKVCTVAASDPAHLHPHEH